MNNKQEFINYLQVNGKGDKSWNDLAEEFNLASGEAARSIYRRFNKAATNLVLKSKWQVQTKDGIEWLESYRNIPTAQDILSVTSQINPIPFVPREVQIIPDNVGLYYLADEHIGAEVSGGLYENEYNLKVVEQRLEKIFNTICEHAVAFNGFKKLIIANLGDSVDGFNGFTTRGGHPLPQNMTNKEVFNGYLDVHSKFLLGLINAGIAENIYYIAVSDSNHGGDFEYICHKSLENLLSNTNIKFHIIEKFIGHVIIDNRCFCFTHGKDSSERKRNFPLNLTPDIESFIKQYIDINDLGKYEVSLIKGDLHQSNSYRSKFFRYRNTSSIFGSSKWCMANYGYTQPACDYDLIINNELLEGRIDLDKPLKSNETIKI